MIMGFWEWAMTGNNGMCLVIVIGVVVVLVVSMITDSDIL